MCLMILVIFCIKNYAYMVALKVIVLEKQLTFLYTDVAEVNFPLSNRNIRCWAETFPLSNKMSRNDVTTSAHKTRHTSKHPVWNWNGYSMCNTFGDICKNVKITGKNGQRAAILNLRTLQISSWDSSYLKTPRSELERILYVQYSWGYM